MERGKEEKEERKEGRKKPRKGNIKGDMFSVCQHPQPCQASTDKTRRCQSTFWKLKTERVASFESRLK